MQIFVQWTTIINKREKEFKSSEDVQLTNNTKGKKNIQEKNNPSMVDFYPCTDYKALYYHAGCVQYRYI